MSNHAAHHARKNSLKRFYCKGFLSTEINGQSSWSILQADGHFLAQKKQDTSSLSSTFVTCDQQRSVLSMYDGDRLGGQAYSPYGHHSRADGLLSLLAFNGERPDEVTGHYHLGKGYRQFNPVMMRFCSPDSWSPFGAGGLNAYSYCAGDPTNRNDPTGHFWGIGKFARRVFGMKPKAPKVAPVSPAAKITTIPDSRAGSASPKGVVTGGDAIPLEKLFTDYEIAEQYQLFEQIGVSRNLPLAKNNRYMQSHGSSKDVQAAQRYGESLNKQRNLVNEHARALTLDKLTHELDAVNKRMLGAGSSKDLMIQDVLVAEVRRRVG
ncbi:RHS repeat-associated core domain-containing protein [Pseudomonas sp. NPDC089395]|uniref:RHS repeat-associated core domain-containing protein n=1 Tax=Pseudomonas sp. NPDC089395 TaxID=3364460 RepID=UPI00381A9E33